MLVISTLPESLVCDQFKPAPAILVVSEAVISLAFHNSRALFVDKTDGEAELSVDSVSICRIKKH